MNASESQLHEKLGGVQAMDELIDVTSAETETKVIKFANRLSASLRTTSDYEFLVQVSRVLDHPSLLPFSRHYAGGN